MLDPHAYLNSFTNFEAKLHQLRGQDFHLGRVIQLLDLLDNPQHGLRIIHVAGTKGKGSTCAMTASILQQAGYKVGLYTSPHLYRVNERIRILDMANLDSNEDFFGCIDDGQMQFLLEQMKPAIDQVVLKDSYLTYFEVVTVLAITFFAQQDVDVVVLETGLGGRWDATNACDAQMVGITPISLDHRHILGDTVGDIAQEKAGIIKDGYQDVIVAPQSQEARDVILTRCQQFNISPRWVDSTVSQGYSLGLHGEYQRINASMAIGLVGCLARQGFHITDEAIAQGLARVKWPARFEVVGHDPVVVVDGAHNGASAHALARAVRSQYPGQTVILVVGVSVDKDVGEIMAPLKDIATAIILTQAAHPRARAFTAHEAQDLSGPIAVRIIPDLQDAMQEAHALAKNSGVIVVTGSLFIAAQARSYLARGG